MKQDKPSLLFHEALSPSEAARRRLGQPLFVCSWDRAVFLHYEVDPKMLQPQVPFDLDLYEGKAYVSLVAFTLRDLRFAAGGPPLATHGFLNVRTYVCHRGELGIYFLAEWLPNPLCVFLGPRLYGLPYRLGGLDYSHRHEEGTLRGHVEGNAGSLRYAASIETWIDFKPCEAGDLSEFLLERYTAFTRRGTQNRLFRIWHPSWPQTPIDARIERDDLIESTGSWFRKARPIGAHYSPGVREVRMGRPILISGGGP